MKLYQIVGEEHENTKGQKRKNELSGWHRHRPGKRIKLEASGEGEGVFEYK